MIQPHTGPTAYDVSAWVLTGLALILVFPLHLFSALMSGLLVYELIYLAAVPLLRITKISHKHAKLVVVGILAVLIVTILALSIWKTATYLRSEDASILVLLNKMAEILDNIRSRLPAWVNEHLPENAESLNMMVATKLREHVADMQKAGEGIGLVLAHVFIGMALGAIVSLRPETSGEYRPLAAALAERVQRISVAFRSIVFAQIRISGFNTLITALYLTAVLPALDINLPLVKTLVAITFFVGMLPVVGNLISNSCIILVSLSFSLSAAVMSLAFLVIIHKLEYVLNARIVGGQIQSRTWELLLAMLFMESAFGIPGLIAAPIYYAYIKKELSDRGVV